MKALNIGTKCWPKPNERSPRHKVQHARHNHIPSHPLYTPISHALHAQSRSDVAHWCHAKAAVTWSVHARSRGVLEGRVSQREQVPVNAEAAEIAALLQKTPRQVQVWFQNHRQRDTKYPVLCLLLCTTFMLKHFEHMSVDDTLEKVVKMDTATVYHLSLLAIAQMDAADADFITSFAE